MLCSNRNFRSCKDPFLVLFVLSLQLVGCNPSPSNQGEPVKAPAVAVAKPVSTGWVEELPKCSDGRALVFGEDYITCHIKQANAEYDPNLLVQKTPETLEQEYHLQEAAWVYLDQGHPEKAEEALNHLETILKSNDFTVQPINPGGIHRKAILDFPHGIRAIFKPIGGVLAEDGSYYFKGGTNFVKANDYWDIAAEVATYKLDRLLQFGIVPLTTFVTIDGEEGCIQGFVSDVVTGGGNLHSKKMALMRILDFLLSNYDRHQWNWLYWPAFDRIVAIDHGMGFQEHLDKPTFPTPWEHEVLEEYVKSVPEYKDYFLKIHDEHLLSTLGGLVRPEYLPILLDKFHQVQHFFKGATGAPAL